MATICCARTSSGLAGIRRASMAPARIRSVTTAACTRSPGTWGRPRPWRRRRPGVRRGRRAAGRRRRRAATRPGRPGRRRPCRCQLQAGGRHHRGQAARLEVLLDQGALLLGDRAVMRAGDHGRSALRGARAAHEFGGGVVLVQRLTGSPLVRDLVEPVAQALRQAPGIGEHDRGRCDWARSAMRSSTCGQIDGRSAPSLPSATGEPPSSPRSSTGTTTDRSNSLPDSGWTISTLRAGPGSGRPRPPGGPSPTARCGGPASAAARPAAPG